MREFGIEQSPYLHSSRWNDLLVPGDGLPNIALVRYRDELWMQETTTGKLVNVGNRCLPPMGIWSAQLRGIEYLPAARTADNSPGTRGALLREHANLYDRNAVAVVISGEKVGHVNKQMAARIAPLVDAGKRFDVVSLAGSLAGEKPARVRVVIADPEVIAHILL